MKKHIIPFFVADRPASFLILKGVLLKYPHIKVGIMTHAFTSKNVWQIFKKFPKELPLLYEDKSLSLNEDLLSSSLVKMTDSGIFSKNGCTIEYEELFERYNIMETDFGVMIDVLRDAKATLKSAEKALRIYEKNKKKYRFNLVAVAQGKTLEEYLECYQKLSANFEFIAIGGLLKKRINSARYVRVRDEQFMYKVIEAIKGEFNPKWLYVLGCYHPSRHKKFEEIGVWGSDYKGWIFNYKLKRQLLNDISFSLSCIEQKRGLKPKYLNLLNRIENELQTKEKEWRKTKDPSAKRKLQMKINRLKEEIKVTYTKLLREREFIVNNNHIPFEYKHKLRTFKEILKKEEQFLRFKQVRKYIEEKIYAQLQ